MRPFIGPRVPVGKAVTVIRCQPKNSHYRGRPGGPWRCDCWLCHAVVAGSTANLNIAASQKAQFLQVQGWNSMRAYGLPPGWAGSPCPCMKVYEHNWYIGAKNLRKRQVQEWMVQWLSHWTCYVALWVRFLLGDNFAKNCFLDPGTLDRTLQGAWWRLLDFWECWRQLAALYCNLKSYKACLCILINIKTLVETPRQLDKKSGSLDRLWYPSLKKWKPYDCHNPFESEFEKWNDVDCILSWEGPEYICFSWQKSTTLPTWSLPISWHLMKIVFSLFTTGQVHPIRDVNMPSSDGHQG